MKALFLIFLIIPLVEIYLLIEIGTVIGAPITIFLVVFTALLGAVLVRIQGFSTLGRVQMQLLKGQIPALAVIEGLFLFVAGALLLTPGFFTDTLGFIFLTPPLRRWIIRAILKKGLLRGASPVTRPPRSGSTDDSKDTPRSNRVIEGEYKDLD